MKRKTQTFYAGNPDDPVTVLGDDPDSQEGNVLVRHASGHERSVPADSIGPVDHAAWAPAPADTD